MFVGRDGPAFGIVSPENDGEERINIGRDGQYPEFRSPARRLIHDQGSAEEVERLRFYSSVKFPRP
jgi:hypothetical protein